MNKVVKVLGYILIAIVLLPIIAIGLYVFVGASLFLCLYIINRKKNGPSNPREGKPYRIISTILFILGLILLYFVGKINFLSWQGYLWLQLVVFVGMLPICLYQYKLIKHKN